MSVSTSTCNSSEYLDRQAFRFKLPKANFSLRAVDEIDGVPKLRFSTANKVPSITEEDVAVCVQLCLEGKRPEFFYCPFPSNHPYVCLGRHYKHYNPGWLHDTSVGELFAEADWKMKGLSADVMCDKSNKTFQSWSKASKLDGLATSEDFPKEKSRGQILMTCKSVDICESKDELLFVGEPVMKIDDKTSSSYAEYLTENFDSIAYHDEPSFLKMKEIVKLMLALEWLRDRGVQFSEEWIKEHTNKQNSCPPKTVQIDLTVEERSQLLQQFQEEVTSAVKELPQIPDLPSVGTEVSKIQPEISLVAAHEKVTDSGIELTMETTHAEPNFKALTELYVPVVTKVTIRVTADNNFDFLLEGTRFDSNQPVLTDEGPVKPDVSSWQGLYAKTMPAPCKIIEGPEKIFEVIHGGCTTSTIPVQKTAPPTTYVTETAQVKASRSRKREKIVPSPSGQQSMFCPPPRNVSGGCSSATEKIKACRKYGWEDSSSRSLFDSDGEQVERKPSLKGLIKIQQLIGGKEVGEVLLLNMHLRPPCKNDAIEDSGYSKDTLSDSGYSSRRSLTVT